MTRKFHILFYLLLTMLILGLSGCAGATPIPEEPTDEPTGEIVPDPAPVSVDFAVEVNYCLDCHADKERLIETAKPVEVVVSENEGAG